MAKKKAPDKLAQEVSQALAAGMSYGKWKATQPVVAPPPKTLPRDSRCRFARSAAVNL